MKKIHGNWDCLALNHTAYFNSIFFFSKAFTFEFKQSSLLSKHHVWQDQPRSKSQALSFLLAILLMTAGSILASVEVQILK